ncbi:hypothetical protein V492_00295 [Pseudogymnoascus sp. VKM F-4246]|nr:hypothetical protein V492_00295 [Pseudogymnoascus sp. VKM F-4246]
MAPKRSNKDKGLTSMYKCLETGAFSDLIITCGNKTWNAHRVVVCPKSSFFRAACNGNFKEAATGVINLEDDNPLVVKLMMEYFYKDWYTIGKLPAGSPSTLSVHIQVHRLGDKYGIEELCALADGLYCKYLRREASFEEYVASIPEVYQPPVSEHLRQSATNHARELMGKNFFTDEWRTILKRVMKDIPEFCFDVIGAVFTAPIPILCEECRDEQINIGMDSCHVCGVIME